MVAEPRSYEIQETAELTGLTPARLRVWERRYAVVRPMRLPNGYRAYSAEQVALLRAFARLVGAGFRIAMLAAMEPADVIAAANAHESDGTVLGEILVAIRALDPEALERLIAHEIATAGVAGFARETVLPLARIIGDLWSIGELPVAAEHFASEIVIRALKNALQPSPDATRLLVCACLPGERHEWGFLATLVGLHEAGWAIHYLGADLPVDEVLQAAWQLNPTGVALTTSNPDICRDALPELERLPTRLPQGTFAAIGGSGTTTFAAPLAAAGFRLGAEAFHDS